MPKNALDLTLAIVVKDHPDIADALRAEGEETAMAAAEDAIKTIRAAAVEGERTRILGIQAHAAGFPGHQDLVAKLVGDGETTPDNAAAQILAAEQQTGARKLAETKADEKDNPHAAAAIESQPQAGGEDANAPLEDRVKAKWDSDPDIRAEFQDNFGRYLAFAKAEDSGKVKVLRKTG